MVKKETGAPSAFPEDINWELLKRFMICASSDNFRDAKNRIGTSASALSKQMDDLEKILGVELFERVQQNRTCSLTEHGQLYLQYLRDVYNHLQNLFTIMQRSTEEHKTINLVTTPGLAEYVIPKFISHYHDQFPEVRITLETVSTAREVKPEEIMVLSCPFPQKNTTKKFLFSHKMGLYASKDYIKRCGKPKRIEDLANHTNLALQGGEFRTLNKGIVFLNKIDMSPHFVSDSFDFLFELCLDGKGIMELPDIFNSYDELEKVLDYSPHNVYDIYIIYNESLILDKYCASFVKSIESFFKKPKAENYNVKRKRL